MLRARFGGSRSDARLCCSFTRPTTIRSHRQGPRE
jgi:hypothetical protein